MLGESDRPGGGDDGKILDMSHMGWPLASLCRVDMALADEVTAARSACSSWPRFDFEVDFISDESGEIFHCVPVESVADIER